MQMQMFYTECLSALPLSPSMRLRTVSSAILRRVWVVALPRWGVMVTLSMARSGWSRGSGSGAVTSRPAA